MRMSTPYKHPKTGIYYLRKAVPKELHQSLNKKMINWSLGTRDPDKAKQLFPSKLHKCEVLFENARNGFSITKSNAFEMARRWFKKSLNEDEAQRESGKQESIIDTNPDTKDLHSYYDYHIEELIEAHESGNAYRVVKDTLSDIAKSEDIPLTETMKGFDILIEAVFSATVKYYRILNKRSDKDWSIDVMDKLDEYLKPDMQYENKAGGGLAVQQLFEKYRDEKELNNKTADETQKVISRFVGMFPNVRAQDINGEMVREFKEILIKTPSYPSKAQGKLSLPKLMISIGSNFQGDTLSDSSINKHLSRLGTVLQWGFNNSYFSNNWNNPTQGKTVKRKGNKKDISPFSNDDINKIFSTDIYTKQLRPKGGSGEASYWLPVIALYTGMRMNEIGQLWLNDVKQKDDVWFFNINENENKNVKNNSSIRLVPIHQKIIDLGFIEYVNSLSGNKVFPLLVNSGKYDGVTQNYSKWFGRHLRKIGIDDKSKVFHSSRHLVKDMLRNAGVDTSINDSLFGHSSGNVGGSYGDGYGLTMLNQAIQKISYDVDALKNLKKQTY